MTKGEPTTMADGVSVETPVEDLETNSKRLLPSVTVSSSSEYLEKTTAVISHAMLPSAIWRVFMSQGVHAVKPNAPDEEYLHAYQKLIREFLAAGAGSDAFIAEAGDFSACASWWPPGCHHPPKETAYFDDLEREGHVVRAGFDRQIEKIRIEEIWSKYGQEYWYLGLLGRDPRKPAVPGAVRAVLQPVIEKATEQGKPIWLTTTNKDTRDMYLHFGWVVVGVASSCGFDQWCMILYPPE